MCKTFLVILFTLCFSVISYANSCHIWWAGADPKVVISSDEVDEENPAKIMEGIECLLKLQGIKRPGVQFGAKPYVSQMNIPVATVEINALYQISYLFYGNYNFADAVALHIPEKDDYKFNKPKMVSAAFKSYRKWFEQVKKIGLEEARKRKLDPLSGSGIDWY